MSQPDYAKAIWWPADPSNWGYHDGSGVEIINRPRAWVIHTPEEDADDYASTPAYFQIPGIIASTTYFVSWLGFIWQCVEEQFGAYGNALIGMPRPTIFLPNLNLNLQSLSVEVEGRRANIMKTMSEGQWTALTDLIVIRSPIYDIALDRDHILGHYEVANNRSDPGPVFMNELVERVQEKEATMPSAQEVQEWADYTAGLLKELEYVHAVLRDARAIEDLKDNLLACWRRGPEYPPLDYAAYRRRLAGACEKLSADLVELRERAQG